MKYLIRWVSGFQNNIINTVSTFFRTQREYIQIMSIVVSNTIQCLFYTAFCKAQQIKKTKIVLLRNHQLSLN